MRTLEHFPSDSTCPICGTKEDSPSMLVPIDGTGDGRIAETQPVHVACIPEGRWQYNKHVGVIYISVPIEAKKDKKNVDK